MTTLSITETLMNNYAGITFIVDNFYNKTYLDNQITGLVSIDYLNLKYSNSLTGFKALSLYIGLYRFIFEKK